MISETKYYQLKNAVKHRIFGEEVHNYWHYDVNNQVQANRADVAQTIIYGREVRAQFAANVA